MKRLRRSELAVPASNPKMIEKASRSAADLVFLDLEDAVAPTEKEMARENAITGLNELDWGSRIRAVRVNDVETSWAWADVVELVTRAGDNLDIIIVPKVRAPRDVWFFDTLLSQLRTPSGATTDHIGIEILIEEAEGLARVEELAGCSPRLEALILGFGDLAASLGFRYGHVDPAEAYPGDPWHFARARLIAAARANGLDAIDGPYPMIADLDGFRREATWASTLGAIGKWAIHPHQLETANTVFAPTENEIAIAQQMCDAYEASASGGDGAGSSSGILVDAASVRIFSAVLARAELVRSRDHATD